MTKRIWNFLSSVKLTIVLFILILIPAVIGTIVQQNAPDPGRYLEIYGPFWNSVFRILGFYDIYHDPRFIFLLALLGLNTFACTLKRFRLRWSLAGMLMTHVGLLFILAGALAGAIFGMKGFMGIREGETTDKVRVGKAMKETEVLPFEVRLEDFILATHEEPTHTLAVLDVSARKQKSHRIEDGKVVPLSQPGWSGLSALVGMKPKPSKTITVDRIIPHAAVLTSLREGPEKTGISGIGFRIISGDSSEEGFAVSRNIEPYMSHATGLGVYYADIDTSDQIEEQILRVELLSVHQNYLEVGLPGETRTRIYSAETGTRFEIEGTEYSARVLRYVPDFVMSGQGVIASRSEFPHNPAVQVEISGPSGSQIRWLFAKFPSAHARGDLPFDLKIRAETHHHDIGSYVLALNLKDSESKQRLILAHVQEGKLLEKRHTEVGIAVPVAGTQHSIVVDNLYEHANKVQQVVSRPGGSNMFAAEITVGQDDSSTPQYLWENTPVDIPGYRVLYAREEKIRDFYSVLQIIDGGEVVAKKKIEVNDPLRYKGYALYQSSYDTEGLSWSGLQVKKDPGVPFVYAGFLIQISGMVVIFYVNPLLRKARHDRAKTLEKEAVPQSGLRKAEGA